MNAEKCFKQNVHGRSLEDIKKSIKNFEATPETNLILNPAALFEYEQKKKDEKEELEIIEEQQDLEQKKKESDEENMEEFDDMKTDEVIFFPIFLNLY